MSFQFLSCPFISLHCLSFHELKLKVPARPKNYTNFLVNLYRNWKSAKNQAKIVACIFFAHGLIFCKTEGWWERSIILFWLFWILALCGWPKFQKRLKLELVCILCLFLFFEFRPCPDWKLMGQVPLFCAFWFCRFCFCFICRYTCGSWCLQTLYFTSICQDIERLHIGITSQDYLMWCSSSYFLPWWSRS